jgi:hypothetical protein
MVGSRLDGGASLEKAAANYGRIRVRAPQCP